MLLRGFAIVAASFAAFWTVAAMVPGWFAVWGARPEELEEPLACDRHVNDPDQRLIRAIRVAAPPETVFRWLCQLRVAPYSYDWIDNLGRRSPRELTPGLEDLKPGQRFMTIFRLVEFDPGRSITLVHDGSLFGRVAVTYDARPDGPGRALLFARLVVRNRRGPWGAAVARLLSAGDLVMMRRQLMTLRDRAEAPSTR